jgi:transposase
VYIRKGEASGFRALKTFVQTLTNWRERILNYFDGRYSNGYAEGVNTKVKLINREAFGYRNFENFCLHRLLAFGQ